MYGRKRYQPVNKKVEQTTQTIVDNSIPTFICSKCKVLKRTDVIHVILNVSEYKIGEPHNKPMGFYKLCAPCGELLKTWVKG